MLDARRFSYAALLVAGGILRSQPVLADSTERVSVDSAGTEADNFSDDPALSADGRFVAFRSIATNLVANDTNGQYDIFVHDRQTGLTERVSVDSAGAEANGDSFEPAVSADGRYIAFQSDATNLVAADNNGVSDVFVRDQLTGTTERVSVSSAGAEGGSFSIDPALSADGRFVAFASFASNLVAGDSNGAYDVFVRDRQTGTTERVSVDGAGVEGNGFSNYPAISIDGRFVAFSSKGTNLVAGDSNGRADIFVRDRQAGTTERVSVGSAGTEGNLDSSFSSISANGRFIAFHTLATNLVPDDTNSTSDVFLHDRQTGTTERISVDSGGNEVASSSQYPAISADGRFIAFTSFADDLISGDANGAPDIFVHDRQTGLKERVSVDGAGGEANSFSSFSTTHPISGDGRFVAFGSPATNLVVSDTNSQADIFVRDRGLLPDGRNDFLADFGGAGLWERLNDTAWTKIHNASPQMVTSGDLDGSLKDEAIVSFSGAGLWARYDNMTWVKLHNATPTRFVAGDFDGNGEDDLVTNFGPSGIWVKSNNGPWSKLHNGTSQDLAVGDLDGNGEDELIADFGGAGLWVRYNGTTWVKRHNASPVHMATGDLDGNGEDELIADFGGGLGIWSRYNNTTWTKLHNSTSQGLAAGDLDGNDQEDLIVDFGASGLWVRYNNATWVKRHNASPVRMLATDLDGNGMSEIVADFGASGLWARYNNTTWTKIHPATTQDLAAGGFD